MVPFCSTSVLAASKCIWKFKKQLLYIHKPQICAPLLVRSFICSSFSLFFFFPTWYSFIHNKVYFVCSEHCHILPSSCYGMKKHVPCMTQSYLDLSWLMQVMFVISCLHSSADVPRSITCWYLPDTAQRMDLSGWGEAHSVMRHYGVPGLLLAPCLSSCLSITQVSFSSCRTFPSNPGSGSAQSVIMSYLKDKKG